MSNKNPDGAQIARYYDDLVATHGHSPEACDASSSEALAVRYEALMEVTDLAGKDVLEVGCGFGDLGARLTKRCPTARYRGIDISPAMIETGSSTHPHLDLTHGDVLDLPAQPIADVVLAQGIFYLLGDQAERQTARLIDHMFALCREAIAFTGISTWSDRQEANEHRLDPAWLLDHCRSLSRRVVIRHDYHPGDVAAYVYKSGAPRT